MNMHAIGRGRQLAHCMRSRIYICVSTFEITGGAFGGSEPAAAA